MDPDFVSSLDHFAVGLVLAAGVAYVASRRAVLSWWSAAALGACAAAGAEIAWELIEYALRDSDESSDDAYADTIAGLADSFAGGALGGLAGSWLATRRG